MNKKISLEIAVAIIIILAIILGGLIWMGNREPDGDENPPFETIDIHNPDGTNSSQAVNPAPLLP